MTGDQHFKAKFYLQSKKYNEGLKYVKDLLAESPEDDLLYAFLSLYYQGLMNMREAESAILNAIKLNATEYLHHKNAAKIHVLSQNFEKADDFISTALNLNPNDADLFGFKSSVLISRLEHKKALLIANEGLKLNPKNSLSLRAKAVALSFLQEGVEAEKISKELLQDNPIDAQNLVISGLVSLIEGKKSSKEQIRSSLALQPNNLNIQNAYRLSLRNELPGFRYFTNWGARFAQPDSMPSKAVFFLYFCFFLYGLASVLLEGINSIWVKLYWFSGI